MGKAIGELWQSLKYAAESKKQKYSLDSYLEIIGEFADRQITDTEQTEGCSYIEGSCAVSIDDSAGKILFFVELYFRTAEETTVCMEAHRELLLKQFTSDTKRLVGREKIYPIDRPADRGDEEWKRS